MSRKLGVMELQERLLKAAEENGYQVLLGDKWLGGTPGSCWDSRRRASYHQAMVNREEAAFGMCDFRERVIWLDPRMNQQHRVSVLVHELGHAILHGQGKNFHHKQWEAEAEEVRRLVGEAVGIGLPENEHDWEGLSRRRQKKAFERGAEASGQLLRVIQAQ